MKIADTLFHIGSRRSTLWYKNARFETVTELCIWMKNSRCTSSRPGRAVACCGNVNRLFSFSRLAPQECIRTLYFQLKQYILEYLPSVQLKSSLSRVSSSLGLPRHPPSIASNRSLLEITPPGCAFQSTPNILLARTKSWLAFAWWRHAYGVK